MTAQELKRKIESSGKESYFFTCKMMKFFGDTMKNYGVTKIIISTNWENDLEVFKLYRRRPVQNGLQTSAYFNSKTFKREFRK